MNAVDENAERRKGSKIAKEMKERARARARARAKAKARAKARNRKYMTFTCLLSVHSEIFSSF